jgi:hypothetical protein
MLSGEVRISSNENPLAVPRSVHAICDVAKFDGRYSPHGEQGEFINTVAETEWLKPEYVYPLTCLLRGRDGGREAGDFRVPGPHAECVGAGHRPAHRHILLRCARALLRVRRAAARFGRRSDRPQKMHQAA